MLEQARAHIAVAGRCLQAYRRGLDTPEAQVGGMLEAEFFGLVRAFLSPKPK